MEILFDNFLTGVLRSFSDVLSSIFGQVIPKISDSSINMAEVDFLYHNIFSNITKVDRIYKKTFKLMMAFIFPQIPLDNDVRTVSKIIIKITEIIQTIQNLQLDSKFTYLQVHLAEFNPSNTYHFQFLRIINLLFFTDFLYQLLQHDNITEYPADNIIQIGYRITTTELPYSKNQKTFIQKWSSIMFIVSKRYSTNISSMFFSILF